MICPLCKNENIKNIEIINKHKLVKLYRRYTNIDYSYLINKDLNYCECQSCKLKFFNPLITGDEKFYNSLQQIEWYYMDKKEEYKFAKEYIKSNDKVLDVGSGKGAFAKYLSTKNYIGLDLSVKAKELAAKNGIVIENETIENHADKNSDSYDVVVSFQVLEHVSNPKSFIEAKVKALKNGGKMIIAVPSEDSFVGYVTNNIFNMPPHHVTRWSNETLQHITKQYNLILKEIYHEKVQEVHKIWFLDTLIQNSLLKPKLIDISFTRTILSKFTKVLAMLLTRGLKDEFLPNGHSIIAIYEKK